MSQSLDVEKLEREVKAVYRDVATEPDGEFHFEMGRPLAERLGYPGDILDRIPQAALDSFAGVGYHFDLADMAEGAAVLDLGSGSGTDVFGAAVLVGESGRVVGLDMTEEQLEKARTLRDSAGFDTVSFESGYIESLPFDDDSFDIVISNGVINLSAQKAQVFEEIARVLRPGGQLALSDIISEERLSDSTKADADLWAACIGGAMEVEKYQEIIENAGLEILEMRENTNYEFTSEQAQSACQSYGVKSMSLGAKIR